MTDANEVAHGDHHRGREPRAHRRLQPRPPTPRVSETVTFTSAATDDEAMPADDHRPRTWDLDNDGQFDDGTGNSVTGAYGAAGDQV